jgi:Na+/proline symporter
MYLMSLTNQDYFIITVFLAIVFVIAYVNRRKNPDYDSFLTAKTRFDSSIEFGLVEIILSGVAGAIYGFNAIYYVFIALIIYSIIQKILSKKYLVAKVNNFNDYIAITQNKTVATITSILNILLLLVCIAVVISTAFKLLQSLMGYGFINNVMGLLGFTVMCLLIGGRIGLVYTKLLYFAIIFISFIAIIVLGIHQIGGIANLNHNLSNLAISQNLSADYYSISKFTSSNAYLIAIITLGLGGFRLISYKLVPQSKSRGISLLLTTLLILPGIIALATVSSGNVIDGKKIVTVMAELPDGQTGYVVKAVDSTDSKADTTPGIIPPLLNTKTNLLTPNQYNYNLANIVVFRHYLPQSVMILSLLMVFAGFMLSISSYMMNLGRVTVNNILIPLGLIAKYGKIGELWSLQVFIVGFTGVGLALSYFLYINYDLLLFIKLIIWVFIVPLLLILFISFFKKPSNAQKK